MSKQSQDVKQIHYFHCTPDRSDYLLLYPNMLRILASAYQIKKFPRIKRHLSLARELFIDSGMISAHKKGEYEWQYQQAFVIEVADEVSADYVRDFQRLVDLRPHGQSSQLPFSFSDPKTNFTPGGENCRKYRWSETGRWNTGSNLEDAHQGAETHLDHGRR